MEVRAVPVDQQDMTDDLKKVRKLSHASDSAKDLNYGGRPAPVLDTPYEPTIKEKKDRFLAITAMKVKTKTANKLTNLVFKVILISIR